MRYATILLLMFTAAVLTLGAAGCEEDEVKVQRSYEGPAPAQNNNANADGETVYQRNVTVEDEGFDDADDDEDDVKIQRSSETTTESQEMLITP